MLPTHQQLADYHNHTIYQRQPGFEYTPVLLGRIASFLVCAPGDTLAVFAFMVPLLPDAAGPLPDDAALLAAATGVIRATIDQGTLPAQFEATYEYRNGNYKPVNDPRWWVPTWE